MNKIPRKWLAVVIVAAALSLALYSGDYGPAAMEVVAMVVFSQGPK